MPAREIACPKCGSKLDDSGRVRKVSDLDYHSLFLESLAPPPEPRPRPFPGGCVGMWLLSLLVYFPFFLLLANPGKWDDLFLAIPSYIVFPPIIALGVRTWYRNRENARVSATEMPAWVDRMQKWQRLYYCAYDDGVFDPDEGSFVAVDHKRAADPGTKRV